MSSQKLVIHRMEREWLKIMIANPTNIIELTEAPEKFFCAIHITQQF